MPLKKWVWFGVILQPHLTPSPPTLFFNAFCCNFFCFIYEKKKNSFYNEVCCLFFLDNFSPYCFFSFLFEPFTNGFREHFADFVSRAQILLNLLSGKIPILQIDILQCRSRTRHQILWPIFIQPRPSWVLGIQPGPSAVPGIQLGPCDPALHGA